MNTSFRLSAVLLLFLLTMSAFVLRPFPAGKPARVLPAVQNDTLDLSAFKGKILVLNFWASWSKASRNENKNLLRVYQVYRLNPKVAFASISLDTDEHAWKTAIAEDELAWKAHYCDFKKYDSPMVRRFAVRTLPRFLVLDAGGKAVFEAANAHELEQQIAALLK